MDLEVINIKNPDIHEIIIGQGNFSVKTVIDIFNQLKKAVPEIECGVAMNEAKPKLTRIEGNNEELKQLAAQACKEIGAGHVFVVYMKKAYPIGVLNELVKVPGVVNVYVATSNPLQIITTKTNLGKAVVGAVDGFSSDSIETEVQKQERIGLLKKLGF